MKIKLLENDETIWREIDSTSPFISCEQVNCELFDNCKVCIFACYGKSKHHVISLKYLKQNGFIKE